MVDVRAWLLWALTGTVIASSTRNPLYLFLLVLTIAVVGAARPSGSRRKQALSSLRFAAAAVPLAALFNGLTAHIGDTVLFHLPARLLLIGGPVTAEALIYGAISGLTLTTILSAFAVFNQVTPVHELVGLTPRALHETGIVLSIALTFIPQTGRSLTRIREAQAVRGHRLRGLRGWLPILIPLLVSGMEQSMGLAEAMVARGYGSVSDRDHSTRTRGLLALGLLGVLGGWLGMLFLPAWKYAALVGLLAGGLLVISALWLAGRAAPRTAYRPRRWTPQSTLVVLGCGAALAAVLLPWPGAETAAYTPYPSLTLPPFDPAVGLGLLGLLMPALAAERRPAREEARGPVRSCAPVTSSPSPARKGGGNGDKVSRPLSDAPFIQFSRFTYTYPQALHPALSGVNLRIEEGEFVLVTGVSGAGKSTLLRALNGLVPHFSGGKVQGHVSVAGHSPAVEGPQVLSRVVGFVFQDPEAQFVVDRVEDEIAFALENLALPPAQMRLRVEEVMDLLGLTPLRDRPLESLSGGEKQRVAIGAALALRPRVLVLDEPTSQLDPWSADEVLQALVRLNRELGLTVILAEHRLERVLPYADRLVYLPAPSEGRRRNGRVLSGPPRQVLPRMELTPPLVTLGKALGWDPLPITLEEAPATSGELRTTSNQQPATSYRQPATLLCIRGLSFSYGATPALRGVDLEVGMGELVALMGRNGSGKTTLLRCVVGLLHPSGGEIELEGRSLVGLDPTRICRQVGYLPQEPDDLLFAETVAEELAVTLRNHGLLDRPPISPATLLERLGLGGVATAYPRDLSVGQRQRVALGAVTVTRPRLLLLDEPTRGMDYLAKQGLVRLLREWQAEGVGVLLVTHDVELAAQAADRVVVLDQGEVVAAGPPSEVLSGPSLFAPQIARLFPGTGWLTVEEALAGLARGSG